MEIRKFDDYLKIHKALYDNLDFANDGIEVVLKGHILVEHILLQILEESSVEPKVLDTIRLSFYQKAQIVRSLHGTKSKPWVWDAVLSINSIRNRIAHKLENPDLDYLIEDFVDGVRLHDAGLVDAGPEFGFSDLAMAVVSLHHELWTVFDGL